MKTQEDFVSLHSLGDFAIIDGQNGLSGTEEYFYKNLVQRNHYPLVLDDLFTNPTKIKALKIFKPDTIVLGTTGVYREKIDRVMAEFIKLKWLPKNAVFTMGEEYFNDFIEAGVIGYKIYPMNYSLTEPMIVKLKP